MKKITIAIVFGMFLISLASAITIYSGESVTLELEKPFVYYSIVGNSTPISLEVNQTGNNVTITFDKYSEGDTFDLIFFDKEKETITIYSGGGGGSSSKTIYKDRNVTEYVDREVEKIVEVEVEKEVPKEEDSLNLFQKTFLILVGIMVLFLLFNIVRKIIHSRRKQIEEERIPPED